MEILIGIITFLLFAGMILCPILILRQINKTKIKFKFITYLVFSLIFTAIIVFIFAYWTYISNLILLDHYGYDSEGMNETEFYGKVLPENMNRVKSLETSVTGIGWPLKAILTFLFYSPYLLVIYSVFYLVEKRKQIKIIKNLK